MGRSPGFASAPADGRPPRGPLSLRLRPIGPRARRRGATRRLIMQKARGHPGPGPGLPQIVGARFQVLFTPLRAVLFTFPSRYLCAIGPPVVLSLAGWCRPVRTGFLRPRPTQGTGPPAPRARTGLSPSAAAFPKRLPLRGASLLPALQPPAARRRVWAVPLPLAATRGVTVCFPFLRVLRCFSSPGIPRAKRHGAGASRRRVAPFGHLRINGRLRLPAAFRSLPRPSSSLGAWASPVRPSLLPSLAPGPVPQRRPPGRRTPSGVPGGTPVPPRCLPLPVVSTNSSGGAVPTAPPTVEDKGFEPLAPSLQSWCSGQLS